MIKKLPSPGDALVSDARLREVLRQADPVQPISLSMLAELEANIMAQLDGLSRKKPMREVWSFSEFFRLRLTGQAVAFASIAIVALGFFIGQGVFGIEKTASLTGSPSVVAFADEASGQFLPVTDPSLGESDDDAE